MAGLLGAGPLMHSLAVRVFSNCVVHLHHLEMTFNAAWQVERGLRMKLVGVLRLGTIFTSTVL